MSEFKHGDWVAWYDRKKRRPAIVLQTSGEDVEINVWVKADELNAVPKQ